MLTIASTIQIAPGVHMPRLGLGTYKTAPGREIEDAVAEALHLGYRSIDTASLYGNEEGIGRAIAASDVPRDEVFVTSKVWNDEQGYEGTLAAFGRSAERLGLDYLDLYLVHWPLPRHLEDTWQAMEELHATGRARAIGVCNHLEHHLRSLLEIAVTPPVVNQIEFHPRLQQPALQALCREHGIAIEAWAPLMRGGVFDIPEISRVASEHGVTEAQVAVRWVLQKGYVVIPKSVHAERIAHNADVYGFELSAADMAAIDALDTGERVGRHPDSFAD